MISMQSTRSFITCFRILHRCISSSSAYLNLRRESKFIKKLLHGSNKSTRKWYDPKTDLHNALGFEQTNKKVSAQTRRRMETRDKLFMKHITDLMSMGEISDIINGGIEITHVKITLDYKFVNVFWIDSTNEVSSVSEEALQNCARIIRHQLSQLRVIGVVPPIQFVKDKQFEMEAEVERRLAIINFEIDKSEQSEQTQLDITHTDTVDQTLDTKPDTNDSEMDESCIELPTMRHDVLGLDHYKIMSRIIASVSKSKEAARRRQMLDMNTDIDESSRNLVLKENDFLTKKEQKKIFTDFLVTRRKEERRLNRTKRFLTCKLLNNNFEEEIESNYDEPEDDCNDDFNNKIQ